MYPDRPDELESSSLYGIMSWYEKDKLTPNGSKPLQLKHLPYCLRRRKATPYIVTYQVINPHQSEENKETYYYYLLKLLKPWRNEQLLQIPGSNFYDTYTLESDNLPDIVRCHQKSTELSEQDADIENAIKERAQQLNTTDELEHEKMSTVHLLGVSLITYKLPWKSSWQHILQQQNKKPTVTSNKTTKHSTTTKEGLQTKYWLLYCDDQTFWDMDWGPLVVFFVPSPLLSGGGDHPFIFIMMYKV